MQTYRATWSEAKSAGDRFYFTGKPCRHGHIDKRFTVNGTCIQCGLKNRSVYYGANKDKCREYVLKNQELYNKLSKGYYYRNPDKVFAKRAKRYGVVCDLTKEQIEEVYAAQGGICNLCRVEATLTLDHKIPLTKQGPHTKSNIQFLCQPCNSRKGAKVLPQPISGPFDTRRGDPIPFGDAA